MWHSSKGESVQQGLLPGVLLSSLGINYIHISVICTHMSDTEPCSGRVRMAIVTPVARFLAQGG